MAVPVGLNVQVVIDDGRIPEALALMPLETAVQIRNAFGRMFGKWYATHVAAVTGARMKNLAKRIKYRVNPRNLTRGDVKTLPKAKAEDLNYTRSTAYLQSIIREGGNALAKVSGAIISRSPVVGIQERGGTVHASNRTRAMTVPIGWPRSPLGGDYVNAKQVQQFKDRYPLVRIGDILYYRLGDEIIPAFVLKEQVTIKPGLRIMAAWNSLEGYRQQVVKEAIDKVFDRFYREARSTVGKAARLGVRLAG